MTLLEIWTKYKKVILAVVSSLLLLAILAYTITSVQSCYNENQIIKAQKAVNAAKEEANNINTTIANLNDQKTQAETNVNNAEANLKNIQEQVNAAGEETNKAQENVNAVRNTDFNNTSSDNANKARCAAFPQSPECKK